MEIFDNFVKFLASHNNESWERFIAWLIMTGTVYFILFREDSKIRKGLKGPDKEWQLPEIIGYFFLYVLPGIITSSFYLTWKIDDKTMWIIEACLLSALGIRGAIDGLKAWKQKHPEESSKTNINNEESK